jgi:UDP-glucose 4-epimerase
LRENFEKMKNAVLVTGGLGYIGSHAVTLLLDKGYEVIIVDNLSNSRKEILDGITKITGKQPKVYLEDLKIPSVPDKIMKDNDIVAVVHFAAYKAVGESVAKPLMYYENNIFSLINTLNAALKHDVKHFIFSSSCTVYGQPDELPVTENSPVVKAESPYGNTKKIAEEILSDVTKVENDFNVISLRYFNPIGAHPTALIGELPIGVPNNLVPFITQTAYGIREQLRVFGDDYNTPDGTPIRDYIDIMDLVEAHIVALERLLSGGNESNYEIFNLGTGKGRSVLEVIEAFERATGVKLNYTITDRRPGDVEKIWADPSKANKILGWKATRTLEDSLKTAWEWEKYYRKNLQV